MEISQSFCGLLGIYELYNNAWDKKSLGTENVQAQEKNLELYNLVLGNCFKNTYHFGPPAPSPRRDWDNLLKKIKNTTSMMVVW